MGRVKAEQLSLHQPSPQLRAALVESYGAAMPTYQVLTGADDEGNREMRGSLFSHVGALEDDESRSNDLYDALTQELLR